MICLAKHLECCLVLGFQEQENILNLISPHYLHSILQEWCTSLMFVSASLNHIGAIIMHTVPFPAPQR